MRAKFKRQVRILVWAATTLAPSAPLMAAAPAEALTEVRFLQNFFGVRINSLAPVAGNYSFGVHKSFTATALAGKQIQTSPPALGAVPSYPTWQRDGTEPAPYISGGLGGFRFDYFHNNFNYGGWHTWSAVDYSSTRGFSVVSSYARDKSTVTWLPSGSLWMRGQGFVNWDSFIVSNLHLAAGRWDQVAELGEATVTQSILDSGAFNGVNPTLYDELQIDLEHYALSPGELRQQSWYPSTASDTVKAEFEKKYYDGYAMTQYATVEAARSLGFRNISLYGWKPIRANWWDLADTPGDPATDWYWQSVGLQVIPRVDSINNSVYCYYWSPQNVAYTLAQNELNLKYVNSLSPGARKPVRPYFWNLLHGGGEGNPWWQGQALPNEDMRAISLLNAFTQYDGMTFWGWSDINNPNLPPAVTSGGSVVLKDNTFSAVLEGSGSAKTFLRYDALYIDAVDSAGNVRFQLIDKLNWQSGYGIGPAFPFYSSTQSQLAPHLRTYSEPLSAMFEGLAMAKLLEWNLRHGTKVMDFDPQQTFAQTLPIARHVVNGDLHIVGTYDPKAIHGSTPRNVMINNFGGIAGLNVTFVADSQVRVYVVRVR